MRGEENAYGSVTLPEEALYGIQTLRTVQNLSFSGRILSQYPQYIQALAMVKKAAALANRKAGVVNCEACEAIVGACDQLIQGKHQEHFPVDVFHGGGSIGTNMNINEVIARLAGENVHPADHVNASQSTSDVCHTAIRIALVRSSQPLIEALQELIVTVEGKAREFDSIPTIARTCLQDGMKISLGSLFSGFASGLRRRTKDFQDKAADLLQVNIGGTVVGSGTGASGGYRLAVIPFLREVTGLPLRLRENLYDAAQNPDDLAALSAQLQMIASLLVKFAKDLRLLGSGPETGFAEIKLPAVQAGSSFFPGKVNPVVPETLIQCGFLVMGHDYAIQTALEHGELHLNIWEGAMGVLLLDSISMLTQAVRSFDRLCVAGIQANQQQCESYAASFIPMIVELKEKYGYAQVTEWMKTLSRDEIKRKYEGRELHE